MLETVDFSVEPLSKEDYKPRRDELMKRLVVLQQQAKQKGVGLVVLFEGWNGAGKGSRISDLMYHLDARASSVYVTPDLDFDEALSFAGAQHGVTGFAPIMQEFWQALGPRGAITFYDRGWYTAATERMLCAEYGEQLLAEGQAQEAPADEPPASEAEAGPEDAVDERPEPEEEGPEDQPEAEEAPGPEEAPEEDAPKKPKKGKGGKKSKKSKKAKGGKAQAAAMPSAVLVEPAPVDDASAEAAEAVEQAREERRIDVLRRYLNSASDFERQLVDDGYVVVKFFVHVTAEAQEARLRRLHDDPSTRWRVSDQKLDSVGNYNQSYRLYDNLLEGSDFSFAPWHLINGEDKRRANLQIAQTLVEALEGALSAQPDAEAAAAAAKAQANSAGALDNVSLFDRTPEQEREVRLAAEREAAESQRRAPRASRFTQVAVPPCLDDVDHGLMLDYATYKSELKRQQKRLNKLEMEMYQKRIPLMIMYEGWDAAGKGGSIKRVAQALDARAYTIFPSPAPTKPELMHPHLWRYWTRLPKAGHVGIYDRSWYGRVLVERVEGFAAPSEWARAYDEINEFEQELVRWGAILLKFWVDISPDEQLRRFEARQADPDKQWKITDEDWRNRDKYPQYKAAVEDMFRLTSTSFAPWMILESDNKQFARVKTLTIVNNALEARLRES